MEAKTRCAAIRFLQVAVGRLHERGLMHEDIKPAHVLVNFETAQVWLTGFGIASGRTPGNVSPRYARSDTTNELFRVLERGNELDRLVSHRGNA